MIDNIPVGTEPIDVAYDSDDGRVYVSNFNSNSVSVIFTGQPPSNTAISSAVDGNNNPVSNSGSTISTSITFNVQATAGTNPIAGFQCNLDGGSFNNCNANNQNEITFNNLAQGQEHTIKIRAVDSQGNVDSIPASFSWTITKHQQPPVNSNTVSNGRFGGHGGNAIAHSGNSNGGIGGNGGSDFKRS